MAAAQSTFILTRRHGIWRVTIDGAFFGDYRSEQHERESIAETQRKRALKSQIILATLTGQADPTQRLHGRVEIARDMSVPL
jgi:hypothetical protein